MAGQSNYFRILMEGLLKSFAAASPQDTLAKQQCIDGLIVSLTGGASGAPSATLADIIELLEEELTSPNDQQRESATALLETLLSDERVTPCLSAPLLHLLVVFFCRRLADYPSLYPAVGALHSILSRHGYILDGCLARTQDHREVLTALLQDIYLQSHTQSVRFRVLELFELLFGSDRYTAGGSLLDPADSETIDNFIMAVEAEKDPRCLILSLKVVQLFVGYLGNLHGFSDSTAEKLFNALNCYFPITFHPPANDPHRITHEMILDAFQDTVTCHFGFIDHMVPFLLEQLETVVDTQLSSGSLDDDNKAVLKQSLSLLAVFLNKYYSSAPVSLTGSRECFQFPVLFGRLYELISIHLRTESGQAAALLAENELMAALLRFLKTCTAQISRHSLAGQSPTQGDWSVFNAQFLTKIAFISKPERDLWTESLKQLHQAPTMAALSGAVKDMLDGIQRHRGPSTTVSSLNDSDLVTQTAAAVQVSSLTAKQLVHKHFLVLTSYQIMQAVAGSCQSVVLLRQVVDQTMPNLLSQAAVSLSNCRQAILSLAEDRASSCAVTAHESDHHSPGDKVEKCSSSCGCHGEDAAAAAVVCDIFDAKYVEVLASFIESVGAGVGIDGVDVTELGDMHPLQPYLFCVLALLSGFFESLVGLTVPTNCLSKELRATLVAAVKCTITVIERLTPIAEIAQYLDGRSDEGVPPSLASLAVLNSRRLLHLALFGASALLRGADSHSSLRETAFGNDEIGTSGLKAVEAISDPSRAHKWFGAAVETVLMPTVFHYLATLAAESDLSVPPSPLFQRLIDFLVIFAGQSPSSCGSVLSGLLDSQSVSRPFYLVEFARSCRHIFAAVSKRSERQLLQSYYGLLCSATGDGNSTPFDTLKSALQTLIGGSRASSTALVAFSLHFCDIIASVRAIETTVGVDGNSVIPPLLQFLLSVSADSAISRHVILSCLHASLHGTAKSHVLFSSSCEQSVKAVDSVILLALCQVSVLAAQSPPAADSVMLELPCQIIASLANKLPSDDPRLPLLMGRILELLHGTQSSSLTPIHAMLLLWFTKAILSRGEVQLSPQLSMQAYLTTYLLALTTSDGCEPPADSPIIPLTVRQSALPRLVAIHLSVLTRDFFSSSQTHYFTPFWRQRMWKSWTDRLFTLDRDTSELLSRDSQPFAAAVIMHFLSVLPMSALSSPRIRGSDSNDEHSGCVGLIVFCLERSSEGPLLADVKKMLTQGGEVSQAVLTSLHSATGRFTSAVDAEDLDGRYFMQHLQDTLVALERFMVTSIPSFAQHLKSLVPVLIAVLAASPSSHQRFLASQCLGHLSALGYTILFPYKRIVTQALAKFGLNDSKRIVRMMAAKVRNEWLVLGNTEK